MKNVMTFLENDGGQDLVEYSLLLAFVVVASAALMIANGGAVEGILFITTTNLNAANKAAS